MDKTKMAIEVFNRRAEAYADKFMDTSLYHDGFDLFCSYLPVGATVIELACGPGNITSYLSHIRPDLKILATDLSRNMLEIAARNNPGTTFRIMDLRAVATTGGKYNGVLCGFGLPYLSKEEAMVLIDCISAALLPGGVCYLSTMEDDHSKSGFERSSYGDEVFMNYHEEEYLVEAINNSGMDVLHMQRLDYRGADGNQTTDLILIAGKRA